MAAHIGRRAVLAAGGVSAVAALGARAAALPAARIGLLHTLSPAPLYIAQGEGDFARAGLDARFVFFQSAQPIAAAAVSGDIDVGLTALTGGFFNLARSQGLRVIAGGLHERPGIQGSAILVSDRAYRAGLTTPAKLGGHSFAITQYGSSFHYMIGRIAEAEHFPLASMVLRPLQSPQNMVAAVATGQVDATIAIASMAAPSVAAGGAHIIGWVGDIVPYQITAVFTTTAMIARHADRLRAFLTAYRQGIALYRAAFFARPADPAARAKALHLIERYVYTGDPHADALIARDAGNYDAGGVLDVADVAAQLAWFERQGMVRGHIDPSQVIDARFQPA